MINDVIGNTQNIKNEKGEGQYRPYAVRHMAVCKRRLFEIPNG